jgi:hypothetical protein
MRKDISKKDNTLNIFLLCLFLFSSTNISFLFFFKAPKMSLFGKNEKILETELRENNKKIDNKVLITNIYKRDESKKFSQINIKLSYEYIYNNKKFHTDNKFDAKKYNDFIVKINKDTKIKISSNDYLEFLNVYLPYLQFKHILKNNLREIDLPQLMYQNIEEKKFIITGRCIKIKTPVISGKINSQQINDFIKREQEKNMLSYVEPEKKTGFVINITANHKADKIIEVVNYYLKHNEFDEKKIFRFLLQVVEDSKDFTQDLELKMSLERSRQNESIEQQISNKNNTTFLKENIHIEYFTQVCSNEDNKLLFNTDLKFYQKQFYLYGSNYCKVFITETIPKQNKIITQNFLDTVVIPTLKAYLERDEEIKFCYNLVIDHNSNKNSLNNNNNNENISFSINNPEYINLIFAPINSAFLLYDVYGNPFIFIITHKTEQVLSSGYNIKNELTKNYNNFFKKDIFFNIFQIYYNKIKETRQV